MPLMSVNINPVAICFNSLDAQGCPRYLNTLESITYNPLCELITLAIIPCTNPNPHPLSHARRSVRPSLPLILASTAPLSNYFLNISILRSSRAGVSAPCLAIAKPARLPCADWENTRRISERTHLLFSVVQGSSKALPALSSTYCPIDQVRYSGQA